MNHQHRRHSDQILTELITKGQQFLQAGDLPQAETCFHQVLRLNPKNVDALHLLGVIAHRSNKLDTAARLIAKAIQENPSVASFHLNLGSVYRDQGKLDDAAACYRKALQLNPNYPKAYNNLGVTLRDQEKLQEAIDSFQNALRLQPDYPEAYLNLGTALLQQGKLTEAAGMVARALQINPAYALAYFNLGNIFREQGKLDEAVQCYQQALNLHPELIEAYNNLGNTFMDKQAWDEAIGCYSSALHLAPHSADMYNNLGTALRNKNHIDEALAHYQKALELAPQNPGIHLNLGSLFKLKDDRNSAVEYYTQALQLDPSYALGHLNLSTSLLMKGEFNRGWEEYEWRWKTPDASERLRPFPQPWWNGENLTGKSILVWGEQGVGDEILFASMLPDVITLAANCIIECDTRLETLFARSFPEAEIVSRTTPPHPSTLVPEIRFQVPMASLARWLRPNLDAFPPRRGYLIPDPQRLSYWKERLSNLGHGLKVGICWRSMMKSAERNMHYTQLDAWKPILSVPGAIFVNLQYDECQQELVAAKQSFGVNIHAFEEVDLMHDLEESAALTAALDLVISAPTSVAAMAGALGVTVWEPSAESANWATLGTDRMPWYPSMRQFLRTWDANWDKVMADIADELRSVVG